MTSVDKAGVWTEKRLNVAMHKSTWWEENGQGVLSQAVVQAVTRKRIIIGCRLHSRCVLANRLLATVVVRCFCKRRGVVARLKGISTRRVASHTRSIID